MIQAGKNISTAGDPLQKIQIDYLYNAIKNPKPEMENRIKQLRIVKNMDVKQYGLLKKQLPYVVCGIFNPPVRRTENFAYTSYFILDIDHISEKEIDLTSLRQRVEADSRVVLSFLSPGEDGLKLMFKLEERCHDPGIYSLFYKLFAADFSKRYNLEQILDTRTSDVTRACFISSDANVHYNPLAEAVNINTFVDTNNPYEMFREKHNAEKALSESKTETKVPKADVDNDVVQHIKEILLKVPPKQEKPMAYVPEELNQIMFELTEYITTAGVKVKEIINISYGKKIRCKIGVKEAEINLFYGKRGYSVVQSPRTGTDPEMNQLAAGLIESFLQSK